MKHTRILLAASALALLGACSDSTDPDGGTLAASGSMSFSFTGAGNGTYSASGVVPANQNAQVTTDWATGFRDVSENSFVLISVQPTSGGVFNQVLINIPRLTTGSATARIHEVPTALGNCTIDTARFCLDNDDCSTYTIGDTCDGAQVVNPGPYDLGPVTGQTTSCAQYLSGTLEGLRFVSAAVALGLPIDPGGGELPVDGLLTFQLTCGGG